MSNRRGGRAATSLPGSAEPPLAPSSTSLLDPMDLEKPSPEIKREVVEEPTRGLKRKRDSLKEESSEGPGPGMRPEDLKDPRDAKEPEAKPTIIVPSVMNVPVLPTKHQVSESEAKAELEVPPIFNDANFLPFNYFTTRFILIRFLTQLPPGQESAQSPCEDG